MSGYRRFIAYVYEYLENHKGENKGFIRVEARNGQCKMQFRLKGRRGQETIPCQVYGYVRKEGECLAILLGNCNMAGEAVDFQLDMPEDRMGDSSYGLKDLAGILIWGEEGIRYGTQWDEHAIDMNEFRLQDGEERQQEPEENQAPEESVETEPQVEDEREAVPDEEEPAREQEAVPELKVEEVETKEEEAPVWTEPEDFQPFTDGAIQSCRKITPAGLAVKNNFLLHGYENYHHLLVGKVEGSGQYILGIPGVYDPQERFMAGVFGFPNFKAARREGEMQAAQEEQQRQGTFGYWYRLVDASDLNI